MLRVTCKDQLISYCEILCNSDNLNFVSNWKIINFLTRYMINKFIKEMDNISDEDEDEILSKAFEFFSPFYETLMDDDVYGGFNDIMLPIDYYRFAGKVLELIAIRFMSRDEIRTAYLNDPAIRNVHLEVKLFMALFPVIEKKYNETMTQKEEAVKARHDTYRVCLALLQGTQQPESQFSNVPIDVLQEHIFPDLLQEHISPDLCASRSASLVSFFNNHLANRNPENSWGLLSAVRRSFR